MKTKTQLLAERQVLRQLITTIVAASGDKDLQPEATDYRNGVCRHFALLFAAGASTPPNSMAARADGAQRSSRTSSLKELDPHLFLDALVEVILPWAIHDVFVLQGQGHWHLEHLSLLVT